jgi:hypothetical protein
VLAVAFWSEVEPVVVLVEGVWAVVLEAAFWSAVVLLLGVLEPVDAALWSVVLGVVVLGVVPLVAELLEVAAFWSAVLLVVLLVLEAEFWSVVVLEAEGFAGALALSGCAPVGLLVVAAGALLVLLVEAALWSVVLLAVPCAGGFTGALALSPCAGAWVVFVVAAGAFALVVSLVGALLLPGAAGVVLLPVAELLVEEALWSVLVLEALAPIDPEPAPEVEAWLWVQESETMFTEVTCSVPSLPRDPCTCTWCPSWGFNSELSPCRFTVWPLSAERIQLPPDCFRQPLIEPDWSETEVVLVAVEFWPFPFVSVFTFAPLAEPGWSVVLPWRPASCPWPCPVAPVLLVPADPCAPPAPPAPAPPPCANAIPEASISARINFLFMSLLLRSLPLGAVCVLSFVLRPVSAEVGTPINCLETS